MPVQFASCGDGTSNRECTWWRFYDRAFVFHAGSSAAWDRVDADGDGALSVDEQAVFAESVDGALLYARRVVGTHLHIQTTVLD